MPHEYFRIIPGYNEMKDTQLFCTQCKKSYEISRVDPRCMVCHEPLEVAMVERGTIVNGNPLRQTILERYADFFPFDAIDPTVSLSEGFTPLVPSRKLASRLTVKNILFKNETENPTWSFKDRGTIVGVQHAISLGYRRIGTVSSGNMAVSVAAYGARAGLRTYALVSASIPSEKLNPIAVYGATVIRVEGDYGDLYYHSLEIGKRNDVYFINSDVPFRVEGSKSIAFEICEQLNFDVPDFIVVPTSSGGNIRGIMKGFEEFKLCGLITDVPTVICAQAAGCAPIYNAYINNKETISRVNHPETIAHAIENPFPPSGNEVLRRIRKSGSLCVAVTDDEIMQAQKELVEEGIFGQPASAVPLAAVRKLRNRDIITHDDTVVCIVTGGGLKYTAVYDRYDLTVHSCSLGELEMLISK